MGRWLQRARHAGRHQGTSPRAERAERQWRRELPSPQPKCMPPTLLVQPAKSKLDPVIGRDDEIRRVLQILSRRTKNNPILIGERYG